LLDPASGWSILHEPVVRRAPSKALGGRGGYVHLRQSVQLLTALSPRNTKVYAMSTIKCLHCGTTITAVRSTRKYCSARCRMAVMRAKRSGKGVTVRDNSVTVRDPTVTLRDDAVTLSDDVVTLSDDAVTLRDDAVTLSDDAVTLRDDAVTLSDDVVTLSTNNETLSETLRNPTLDEIAQMTGSGKDWATAVKVKGWQAMVKIKRDLGF
jgi:hypothetical protein